MYVLIRKYEQLNVLGYTYTYTYTALIGQQHNLLLKKLYYEYRKT